MPASATGGLSVVFTSDLVKVPLNQYTRGVMETDAGRHY
jgi:hypothetical protein